MQRVLLTTGGTGGHIFPALAVAEVLRSTYPQVEILFMGSEYGPEKALVSKAGIAFEGLAVRGLIGRGAKAFQASFAMMRAVLQARRKVKEFRPEVAIGFGGYAAFAPLLAAKMCKVPTALHEQNAVVGVSNKVLGKLVDKVFLSMPLAATGQGASQGFAPHKTVLTGNPVRAAVAAVGLEEHTFTGKNLLIVGGSQGAKALNTLMLDYAKKFEEQGVHVRHQTGSADFSRVQAAYAEQGIQCVDASAFMEDMAEAYAWADLVLCRSGASTVAELAAAGRGAVFVPFPHATHDHQTFNARILADFGAAKMYAEKNMRDQGMMEEILLLLNDAKKLQDMATKAKAQAHVNAAQDIVSQLQKLAQC